MLLMMGLKDVCVHVLKCTYVCIIYIYIICDRICEHCKNRTLEIRAFERGHVVLDPNIFYCTTVHLAPLTILWCSLRVISASIQVL